MKLLGGKIFCTLLLFCSILSFGQNQVVVRVNTPLNEPAKDARVEIPELGLTAYSDRTGEVRFRWLSNYPSEVRIIVLPDFYPYLDTTLAVSDSPITLTLRANTSQLEEVVILAKEDTSTRTTMGKIEGVTIVAGKKNVIIRPSESALNLANNNAREVYSEVAGMSVWEGDESGIQLNIGGRGLNPNRASNFNVRQNGYDISPDALGYPESYYTPPAESVERIDIVKGAASLQYGTQFGGLINFRMKGVPKYDNFEVLNRTTGGTYGFFNQFTSLAYRKNKTGIYAYGNYRRGNGWRPNSDYNSAQAFVQFEHNPSENTSIIAEYTYLYYLAQQPGGLDDNMFADNPRQSNRERNWFGLNWNLFAVRFNQKWDRDVLNIRLYGLYAGRNAIGFRNYRPAATDPGDVNRELITGEFANAGLEARYLKRFNTGFGTWATLLGARLYSARNNSQQGLGSAGSDANFEFADLPENLQSDYEYPNDNVAVFLEQMMVLNERWTVTPGARFEYINTRSNGYYRIVERDLAGNIILNETVPSGLSRERSFVLVGLGIEYQATENIQTYFNLTQNFRAITYSDIHIVNPSFVIDENIEDERGFSLDIGARKQDGKLTYDVSAFLLNYDNRIGELAVVDSSELRLVSYRTNIGQALIYGLESYFHYELYLNPNTRTAVGAFVNFSAMGSTYLNSDLPGIQGNELEFVPRINLKTGLTTHFQSWRSRLQWTYLSDQYSDAANDVNGGAAAVTGLIPSFNVMDFGASYTYGRWQFEGGINNLFNQAYFTRRATGYPGPGIIPSPGISAYLGFQVKL